MLLIAYQGLMSSFVIKTAIAVAEKFDDGHASSIVALVGTTSHLVQLRRNGSLAQLELVQLKK